MKKLFINCFIVVMVMLAGCTDENLNSLELVDPESNTQPTCSILGPTSAAPGDLIQLRYNADFGINNFYWSVFSFGGMSVVSGQGTENVTISLGPNFDGGTVHVNGTGPLNYQCSASISIEKETPTPTCSSLPTGCLNIGTEACSTAFASISPGCYDSDIQSIDWTWSLGSFNDIPISNANSIYNVVLNIPTNQNYNNYILVFKAKVNYSNGCPSKTLVKQKTLFGCGSPGGPIG